MIYLALEQFGVSNATQVRKVGDTPPSDLKSGGNSAFWFNIGVTNGTHSEAEFVPHPHDALLPRHVVLVQWLESYGVLPAKAVQHSLPGINLQSSC
ncbi:MAG: hypothetical protein AAFX41_16745 [Bacteroidota bacterium]